MGPRILNILPFSEISKYLILVFPDVGHLVLDFFTKQASRPLAVLNLFPSAAGRRTVTETVVVPIDAVNLSSDSFCLHLTAR